MDILKPELMWVDGRCFRINRVESSAHSYAVDDDDDAYSAADYGNDNRCEPEEEVDEIEVEKLESGRFKAAFHVPQCYLSFIIGAKGATRHRLENETRTQILVPKKGASGDVVVTGSTAKGVSAAYRRISLIVMSARQKQQFTHFLSIPVTGKEIKQKFLQFKEEVLERCKNRGIDATVFQVPEKLHLTLGTLALVDNEERKKAAEILEEFRENIAIPLLENEDLQLQMKGVEYMNDDPAEVDVLYGKVLFANGSGVLQELADSLVDCFCRKGLMQKQYDQVKLHVTLMNTLFREDKSGVSETETSRRKQKPRESFDATSILKTFGDYDFGKQTVTSIHLSQRYSTSSDGYYQASANIQLQ